MSASFIAQGAFPVFPTFEPLGSHYLDRHSRSSATLPAGMGTVPNNRTGDGRGTGVPPTPASDDDRRASIASSTQSLSRPRQVPSDPAPVIVRRASHAPSQPEHTSSTQTISLHQQSSADPINPSMADNRYPTMSAPFSPFFDYAGPSSAAYSRYSSSAPGAEADEYDVLAHTQLVSRAMEQPFCSPTMPVTWAPYPPPFSAASYQQYPAWQMQCPSPVSMVTSPMGSIATTTQAPFANTIASPFQPPGVLHSSMGIPIPGRSQSEATASTSSDLLSPSSSVSGSVGSHRPGPIRTEKSSRRSDAGIGSSKDTGKTAGRNKPMTDVQKNKADLVRDLGACWRCRRYKKSCDGPGECSNCMRGNFRVWPSSLGCRRGCLEELVSNLVPVHAADVLAPAARLSIKPPNWRFGTFSQTQRQAIEEQLPQVNSWQRLSLKVQSTGMFGGEFATLLDIVTKYQAAQQRPNALLESSISLLDATCDIYQNFITSAWPLPPADINAAIVSAQRAYSGVSKMFLTSALSGRRRDWLPSFLSMCMAFCAVMIMMDAAIAVPQQAKVVLWGSVHDVSRDLRTRLYPVTTDLLRASSNGTKPFALGCWSVNELVNPQDGSIELVRSPEGMRMLGHDKAAFDGMRSLQEWIRRNIRLMDMGTKVIRSDPFTTPEVPSIAAILKLFDL